MRTVAVATKTFDDLRFSGERSLGVLLTALMGQSSEAMIVCDDCGVVAGWNQSAEDLYGYTATEMLGRDPSAVAPEQFTASMRRLIARALHGEAIDGVETIHEHKDRRKVEVSLRLTPIREGRDVIGVLLAAQEAHLVIANRERLNELERLAAQDALTGLPNRRTFDVRFALECARAQRDGSTLAIALMDIDRFKSVNDSFGHQVGDRVLERVGELLGSQVRFGEILARVGGEEFAWILRGADVEGAGAAVKRARAAIAGEAFADTPQVCGITLSAGICVMRPGMDERAFYGAADAALLEAKRTGRDRVVVAASNTENYFPVYVAGEQRPKAGRSL